MIQTDVIELLKNMSQTELRGLGQFLSARISDSSYPLTLFKYLYSHYPDFPESDLSYDHLSTHLVNGKILKKVTLQNALSDLRIQIKKYCARLELDENPALEEVLLLKYYKRHNHQKLFDKHFKTRLTRLDSDSSKDMWMAFRKQQFYHEYYFDNNTDIRKPRAYLKLAIEALEDFYSGAKLRYATELYNGYNLVQDEPFKMKHLEEIKQSDFQNDRYLYMYQLMLTLIISKSNSVYETAKNRFINDIEYFSGEDRFVIFSYLMNFISSQIKQGQKRFLEEAHRLYRIAFEKEFTSIDGKVNLAHFLNAIDIASDLDYFRWANDLIERHSDDFTLERIDYAVALANGMLNFKKKRFEECLSALRFIEIYETDASIRGRWLKIRCFYELKYESDLILNFNKRLKQSVSKNKVLSTNSKEIILNSLKLMNLLAKGKKKDYLKGFITNNPKIITSGWFDEKLKAL